MTVEDCVATLSISDINLPLLENTWYSSAATYDITGISADIVQQPACNYGYAYSAYWIPQGETELFTLPQNEISFANNVFTVEKCNPLGSNTPDNQCNDATVPYEKDFNLVFKVSLQDGKFNTLNEVFATKPFSGVIYDACPYDTVSISPSTLISITNPSYQIKTTFPASVSPQWNVEQTYYLCPLLCTINERDQVTTPGFITDFSNLQTAPYSNPSIQVNDLSTTISTINKAYDGLVFLLDITCTSTRSTSESNSSASTALEVSFRDECYDSVIQPPTTSNDMIYLYSEFAMSFTPSV